MWKQAFLAKHAGISAAPKQAQGQKRKLREKMRGHRSYNRKKNLGNKAGRGKKHEWLVDVAYDQLSLI